MSRKFIIKSFFVTTAGLFFGYTIMNFSEISAAEKFDSRKDRTLASSPMLKIGADQISRDYYDLKIINEITAEKNSETSVIKVIISAKRNLPLGLQYKWQLHNDMTSSDVLDGALEAMPAGTQKEFSLRVVGFSKQINSHVNFLVYGQMGDHNLRRSIITSSRPEDSFEYVVEQAALNEQNTGKIQKLNNGKSVRKKFDLNNVVK